MLKNCPLCKKPALRYLRRRSTRRPRFKEYGYYKVCMNSAGDYYLHERTLNKHKKVKKSKKGK